MLFCLLGKILFEIIIIIVSGLSLFWKSRYRFVLLEISGNLFVWLMKSFIEHLFKLYCREIKKYLYCKANYPSDTFIVPPAENALTRTFCKLFCCLSQQVLHFYGYNLLGGKTSFLFTHYSSTLAPNVGRMDANVSPYSV